ncbi:uncharacterized protein K02A2.6-like [Rhopilema esculentum]|uniref:uncharacterized protein K02A2.6-like n=1 Tax=Rhopilema esculentum TaxID=499914 RepID=UPI0031D3DE6C
MSQLPSVSIKPVAEFRPHAEVGASLATRWNDWLDDFEMFLVASGITDNTRKRALLLYQAGPRVREIFKNLTDVGEADDFDSAKAKLTEYFEPQKNRRYEVYRFRQATQAQQETLDQFHTRLRTMAHMCEFHDVEFEIEEQIIIGGTSSKIRKRALRDPNFDLKAMLLEGRRDEQSTLQVKEIESKDKNFAEANKLTTRHTQGSLKCFNCGGSYPHTGTCPAKGRECKICKKQGHFANVCREKTSGNKFRQQRGPRNQNRKPKTVHSLDNTSFENMPSSDEDYLYAVNNGHSKSPKVAVTVCDTVFQMTIDTGAAINVIDQNTFSRMKDVNLQKTNMKAFPYSSSKPVHLKGQFNAVIETKNRLTLATFYVMNDSGSGNLLSSSTAMDLGLISLHLNTLSRNDTQIDAILNKYPEVFDGLGKLKDDTVTLSIDHSQTPKIQPQRRIPYHMRQKVKEALKKLEKEDIIERVPADKGTPWVSPIVIVPKKDGAVRICVDMRVANNAINRIRHPIPTVDDVSCALNGAKFFSKLDLSQAYHQLELSEESRNITTFSTQVGLFRYKRLNYDTNASAEIFQYTLQKALQGLNGVQNIADDIVVYGATREEHDANLDKCLERLKNKGLTLNKSKCKFLSETLDFFGQIFSKDGTRPDPKRVNDLLNAAVPKNAHDVRSLLGMANYSSKYIPNFATITAPLRELTKKNAHFSWNTEHQAAFTKLTTALSSAPCMSYFDKNKESYVLVDASPVGLSAILSQKTTGQEDQTVIAYASRALTDVETRYSQTEKEALAIVWSVEHFHLYLYGHPFTLITDHKPLEVIYGNRNSKPSARIERWVLRLQPYSFNVIYKPGIDNPADYLSRHPAPNSGKKQQIMTEEYVNFITEHSVPKAMTLKEIADATSEDHALKGLRAAIRLNQWSSIAKSFSSCKDEYTIGKGNIILRGTRIVIPNSLQQKAIDLAHESHQGLSKTKALLREKVWFPAIDEMVKKTIDSCIACQAVGQAAPPEPIQPSDMPSGPWEKLHIDFCGPLPSNDYLLVVVDRYSRYPEVEVVKSTKASCVIPKLDKMFATHGIPVAIKTDNGPPFSSEELRRYCDALNIKHEFSTPYWPQANGEVERFNQPLEKALQTAAIEGKVWRQELQRFLLQYRSTPHCTTKVAPSQLLFNRKVRGKIPEITGRIVINKHKEARENEIKSQNYHTKYANQRRNAKESSIAVGDTVLVKQQRRNKITSRFNKTPYLVVERKGTQVTAENSQKHRVTRNVSHFKRFNNSVIRTEESETDSDVGNEVAEQRTSQEHRNKQTETGTGVIGPGNRRSQRLRRPPERFGEAMPSNIIT